MYHLIPYSRKIKVGTQTLTAQKTRDAILVIFLIRDGEKRHEIQSDHNHKQNRCRN